METNNEVLYMTCEGYLEQVEFLEKIIKDYESNAKKLSKSFQDATGDGAHDNAEFETLLMEQKLLVARIKSQKKKIKAIKIIEEKFEFNENIIAMGDDVEVNLIYDNGENEIIRITIVGTEGNPLEKRVSINAPLGACIYGCEVGDKRTYEVINKKIQVEIIAIYKQNVKGKKRERDKGFNLS